MKNGDTIVYPKTNLISLVLHTIRKFRSVMMTNANETRNPENDPEREMEMEYHLKRSRPKI